MFSTEQNVITLSSGCTRSGLSPATLRGLLFSCEIHFQLVTAQLFYFLTRRVQATAQAGEHASASHSSDYRNFNNFS